MQGSVGPSATWSLRAVICGLGLVLASSLWSLPTGSVAAARTAAAGKDTDRSAWVEAVVEGTVDCSDVLRAAGYAGSPLELRLSSGPDNETLLYPDSIAIPGKKGIFGSPTYELYRFTTAVPTGKKSVTVRWSLSCQDKDGDPAGNFAGHFPLARSFTPRHPATRDICNHGGSEGIVLTLCNTALSAKLGACAFAIVTAGTGSKLLDIGSLAADPPKTWKDKLETALSEASGPLVGVVLACAPLLVPSGSTTTTTTPGATTTTTPSQWPTHRDDVNIAVSAWLGSDFVFPDWMSCDPNYCIAGSAGTVYVFSLQGGVNEIGTIPESAVNAAQALAQLGIPQSDITALLAPTG